MIQNIHYSWLILFIPLISCLTIVLLTRKYKDLSSYISIAGVGIPFFISLIPFYELVTSHGHFEPIESTLDWIVLPGLTIKMGTLLDPLSILMLMVVTGVGSLIHIFARGYMHGEEGFSRFFACLSLFIFSMLGIVLSTNYLQIFVFWELVGVASYLLIGYYYEKRSAAEASVKAFMVNKIGDFGFILGILVLYYAIGSFNFYEIEHILAKDGATLATGTLTMAALLIFCGAMGKSAQLPLHVWLPDAMEGPTPVSALIHAATMVVAGVYLVARTYPLLMLTPFAMEVVAYIGGLTALFAATIAISQNDIKRILAFSTLSQIGYMIMAMGVVNLAADHYTTAGYTAAMFHVTTHAFFKALLFLGSGSVIHAVHSQDIWDMGGLRKYMPWTYWTFFIGYLALAGLPPFAGFWSKDLILGAAHDNGFMILFVMGSIAAFLTPFYMTRLWCVAFTGPKRTDHHAHESPAVMTVPLIILAVLAVVSGVIGEFGIPGVVHGFGYFIHYGEYHHGPLHWDIMIQSTVIALLGLALGWFIYGRKQVTEDVLPKKLGALYEMFENKYYFDEVYFWIVKNVYNKISAFTNWCEVNIVIGFFCNGLAFWTRQSGAILRLSQSGKIQSYAFIFVLGLSALVFLSVF
ncbi:MAG: NADH-quinone oxidoreductase subunit L [Deltaproteobacteria bacterium]|nr:NADH-quinone oxidoreductase subunit L [Deltaproteobacteria bacterium]